MDSAIPGTRIRQFRREAGMTQAALARTVGISPSYLNLIEWNKRPIAGTLLRKIAETLDVTLDDLGSMAEERLRTELLEISHLPALESADVELDRSSELIGRFPGWARGMAALARSEREATIRAQVLSDRLSNDPFLGEEIHKMLNRMAVIRSASDILVDYTDLTAERRDRFIRIINDEIRVLSDNGEALATYLDKVEHSERYLTSIDEVEALFDVGEGRFDGIEDNAGDVAHLLDDTRPVPRKAKAKALVEEHLSDQIERVIADSPHIETSAAAERARRMLADYAVGAVMMPMAAFAEHARRLRYDIEALADAFSAEVDTVCHRLISLPRAAGLPRFGYLKANASGVIIEKLGFEKLVIPRYAAACPLWVLFRAQQSPESVIRQRALFPSGDRFVFIARARNTGMTGFGKPRHYVTDMLVMTEAHSEMTVYAPDPQSVIEEVGPGCRLCNRRSCAHRVEDSLTG
jgi:predicted transcriptional regulator/transcriptional regulator with XRE-family HTH domain